MDKRNVDPRRRKQARHMKKNRRRQRRRWMLLAVLLVTVGLAAGGSLWFLNRQPEAPAETTLPAHQQTRPLTETQPEQTEPDKPQTGTTVIHISVAGDLNVTDTVLENAAHENGYDFSQTFLDGRHIQEGLGECRP